MGWLGQIFGRRRREERRRVQAHVRTVLEHAGPEAAWRRMTAALIADTDADELLHLAAEVLRRGNEARLAEMFARSADAPHDPRRLLELGSALLGTQQPEAAAAILERAIAFVPFDAVVRSELALAYAHSGRPEQVLETLALHPCLGDDPGALFEFGWAALLMGDLGAVEGVLRELSGARSLRKKLEASLARAQLGMESDPPDARDFYFVEHGGLLLDAEGALGGRHDTLTIDAEWTDTHLGALGHYLFHALEAPRHVVALREQDRPLAERVAAAAQADVLPAGRGRPPAGVVVTVDADALGDVGQESWQSTELVWFALTMPFERPVAHTPDFLGAFAREVVVRDDALQPPSRTSVPNPQLTPFMATRQALLPPTGTRVRSAFLPDAPLPR
ncbi:MAG: tetratricopeptide repeat protein [Sandaracinaceae bacterium]